MIARIWHGRTRLEDYEAYTEFLKERAIPKVDPIVKTVLG